MSGFGNEATGLDRRGSKGTEGTGVARMGLVWKCGEWIGSSGLERYVTVRRSKEPNVSERQ